MALSASIGAMFRREQPPEHLPDFASQVEAAGFDELWVVEDCFFMGGVAQASTALAATSQVTVGLGIAPAVARNASFLAMEFATLARMHPGRFHGGIGHGVAEWMEQIGARPASWLAALEETTTAVRSLLAGEEVTTSGTTVRLRDVRLEHVPETAPLVSLGVRGVKSLGLSGRCADGTILAECSSPVYVRWARARTDEGRRYSSLVRPHRLTVFAHCAVSERDPDGARTAARRAVADAIGDGGSSSQTDRLPYAAELDALIAEGGADALFDRMPDAWLDDLAITGSPEEGAATIARLVEAGADSVTLVPPATLDPDAWLDTVAGTLLPLVRDRGVG